MAAEDCEVGYDHTSGESLDTLTPGTAALSDGHTGMSQETRKSTRCPRNHAHDLEAPSTSSDLTAILSGPLCSARTPIASQSGARRQPVLLEETGIQPHLAPKGVEDVLGCTKTAAALPLCQTLTPTEKQGLDIQTQLPWLRPKEGSNRSWGHSAFDQMMCQSHRCLV